MDIQKLTVAPIFVMIIILIILFVAGCATEKKDWQEAVSENTIESYQTFMEHHPESSFCDSANIAIRKITFERAQSKLIMAQLINTIPAYKEFLKEHPNGTLSEKAQSGIQNLYSQRSLAFRHTKTIRIIVNQSFDKAKNKDFYSTLKELPQKLFERAGLKIIEGDENEADVIFRINSDWIAIGGYYTGDFSGYFYTGASVSGTISLHAAGIPPIIKSFKWRKDKPEKITSQGERDPSRAPSLRAFRDSEYAKILLEMIGDAFGPSILFATLFEDRQHRNLARIRIVEIGVPIVEPLIAVLQHETKNVKYTYNVKHTAIEALGKIKDPRVLEPLIAALKDTTFDMQYIAMRALLNQEDSRTVERLILLLGDQDRTVHADRVYDYVIVVLVSFTGQNFGEDQDAWYKWWEENKDKFLKDK